MVTGCNPLCGSGLIKVKTCVGLVKTVLVVSYLVTFIAVIYYVKHAKGIRHNIDSKFLKVILFSRNIQYSITIGKDTLPASLI